MAKKFLAGALIVLSSFGVFSFVSAATSDNYDCRDGYCKKNLCCSNYYRGGDCYRGGNCYRGGDYYDCDGYCR